MQKIAIIGAGMSGLAVNNLLKDRFEVKIFEKTSAPGGLIKCDRVDGNLFHLTGGHVFNSKYPEVLDWFWKFFDRENEFVKTPRNAVIQFAEGVQAKYPLENFLYMLDKEKVKMVICDLLQITKTEKLQAENFEDFLKNRFGTTLYEYYFCPYNEKIWKRDLRKVPLEWLEGKLPMPPVEEILYNNFFHIEEQRMVHSSFYYPKDNGSQFLANRLSENLDIQYNTDIQKIEKRNDKWIVECQDFDKVIFCGNIKEFPKIFGNYLSIAAFAKPIEELEYHGTTSVLCKIQQNPFSWIYLPDKQYLSHRIICTGNFAVSNNCDKNIPTCIVEFTDRLSVDEINENLAKMPFGVKYIAHNFSEYTYPIQNKTAREMIINLKQKIKNQNVYLLGRFSEWEYYNMDAAIKAAMELNESL
jgi:protoporphyrinogen oxidase